MKSPASNEVNVDAEIFAPHKGETHVTKTSVTRNPAVLLQNVEDTIETSPELTSVAPRAWLEVRELCDIDKMVPLSANTAEPAPDATFLAKLLLVMLQRLPELFVL